MATTLKFRRFTTAQLASTTGAEGELFVDLDKDTVVVNDGSTAGGIPLATEAYVQANGADLSSVSEDVLPQFTSVYDLGSIDNRWYDTFISNSLDINGSKFTADSDTITTTSDMVVGSLLVDNLLLSDNLITPDTTTARQYAGDLGWAVINGNLDIEGDMVQLPVVENTIVAGTTPGQTVVTTDADIQIASSDFYFRAIDYGYEINLDAGLESLRTAFIASLTSTINAVGGFEAVESIRFVFADGQAHKFTYNEGQFNMVAVTTSGRPNISFESLDGQTPAASSIFTGGSTDLASITITTFETGSDVVTPPSTSGLEGSLRFNKSTGLFEGYNGTEWKSLQFVV
jgi:hypothetical protein